MGNPEISDVLINGPDSVFIERNGLFGTHRNPLRRQ